MMSLSLSSPVPLLSWVESHDGFSSDEPVSVNYRESPGFGLIGIVCQTSGPNAHLASLPLV
jgi:hypothetical protein